MGEWMIGLLDGWMIGKQRVGQITEEVRKFESFEEGKRQGEGKTWSVIRGRF